MTGADQVYVSGLPSDTTEADIEAHFGSIGVLKVDKKRENNAKKIWLYKDKATGELKVWLIFYTDNERLSLSLADPSPLQKIKQILYT